VTAETMELVRMFPKLCRPRCAHCEAAQDREEIMRKARITAARELAEREARLETIPPEMLRTSINHPSFNPGLWVRVEGWQPSGLKWLGIVGGAGECKTRCMALLAKRLILDGHRLTWTTAVLFQDRVNDTLRGDRAEIREANRYFSMLKSTGILVLDDFGKNTWNPTVEKDLFSLIDYRKTHDLPILWTANSTPIEILTTAGLSKDRGAPLIGRLLEASTIEKV